MLVTMNPPERSRMLPNTSRMWVLGAYLVTTCSVTQQSNAFCTSPRSLSTLSMGRTLRRRGDISRRDFLADMAPLTVFSQPGAREGSVLSMKAQQKVRQKGQARRRRGGPRTDAEGYTAEAFVNMRHEVALQVATSSPNARKERKSNFNGGLDSCPCLVLNADYQPLSYLPLSLWGWQDVIKAVFMNKVTVVATYGNKSIRSARMEVQLPSVIALNEFVNQHRTHPAFTRRNLFLRDEHKCQYCLKYFPPHDLSFDHVLPKTLGGKGTWDNVVTACGKCNNRKSDCHPRELRTIGMSLAKCPRTPTFHELQMKARRYPPSQIHETWEEFLYFEREIEEGEQGAEAAS